MSSGVTWFGTPGPDYHDFLVDSGNGNDAGYGYGGDDTILGWSGDDYLTGGDGNDSLYGEAGRDGLWGDAGDDALWGGADNDHLFGGAGNDTLNGGAGSDVFFSDAGVDQLWGGTDSNADSFAFYTGDTGDLHYGQADTIYDFSDVDEISLYGSYTYAGNTSAPSNGQYSIWQNGSDWVVTYNSDSDTGYHDIIVKGANPYGHITFFGDIN
jgi:Ca2+-binding RTX toxin-like protein